MSGSSDVGHQPPPDRSPANTRAYEAEDRAGVYQAVQPTAVYQGRGDDEVRRAAVVIPLSPDTEGRAPALVGRDQASAALLDLLQPARPATRGTGVSVISGLPGVGKTVLARQVASRALAQGWFTAALFADLHGYDPDPHARVIPAQLFSPLLRALGISVTQIPASGSEQAASYHQLLASMVRHGQRILLVLDNVSSPAQVSDLLPDASAHCVVITSRHTLGELDNVDFLELGTLQPTEAVAVLAGILRRRDRSDQRISQHPREAGQLAHLCGCLPLALRITGALLAEDRTLPLADLAGDLADASTRLESLVYGERAVSAAFELSWRYLVERDEQAATLFLRLPINPGPEISSEAAAALLDRSPALTRRWLRVLRRGHFIEPGADSGRWRMHDLLRLYADGLRRMKDSSDFHASVRRLLDYYLATADAAKNLLLDLPQRPESRSFADRDDALAWLDVERPNLTGAVLLAAETGFNDLALDLSLALSTFLRLRRHFEDYVVTATAGMRAAGHLDDPRRAIAVSNLGLAPQEAKLTDEVIASHRRDCERCHESNDRKGEAWALSNLGSALWAMGRFDDVVDTAERAGRIFAELHDPSQQAWSLTTAGLALDRAGQPDRAIDAQQRACAIFRKAHDRSGEAWALTNLGAALRAAKRFDEAMDAGEKAGEIFRERDDRTGVGATLVNRGVALDGLHRYDEAVHVLRQACDIFHQVVDRQREGTALTKLGIALRHLGHFDESIAECTQAQAAYQRAADRYGEASALTELGGTLREAHLIPDARRQWEGALELFQEIGALKDAQRVRSMITGAGHDPPAELGVTASG